MSTDARHKLKIRKILFVALLAFICLVIAYAAFQKDRPWIVPEEIKKLKNPLEPSGPTLEAARGIYKDECAQCHGDRGRGDGPESAMHSPAPADLTDAGHMNGITDGEIFYQISQGKKPMPSFKKRLTEEQRWGLVLFVRSLARPTTAADKNAAPGKDTASSPKD